MGFMAAVARIDCMNTRTEHDLIGDCSLPADVLCGVHTHRAMENFAHLPNRPVHRAMIHAFGSVKLACATTNHELGYLTDEQHTALAGACEAMVRGELDEHIVVSAWQGGAGTSTNMNVNEVLANVALKAMGKAPGDYDAMHPLDHVNLHQSTNDTYPTAIRVAAMRMLAGLERAAVSLQEAFQAKEREFAHVVKIGRTQLQDAVLTTLGREMGAYGEALTRDRWRVFKCNERLRVVNLGGTAIGTGAGAPRQYIFQTTDHLRTQTGLNLARAENLVEATQNQDALVEVHGVLTATASTLMKIATDLRLMASGPSAGLGEIHLPAKQAGSSIMPGKVNPVIPEAVTQAALRVIANHQTLATAAGMGNLELNAFGPLMAETLLESIDLLTGACDMFRVHCVEGIEANEARCRAHVENSTAILTVLVESLGHDRCDTLATESARSGKSIRQLVLEADLLTETQLEQLLHPTQSCNSARVVRDTKHAKNA